MWNNKFKSICNNFKDKLTYYITKTNGVEILDFNSQFLFGD